MAIDAPLVFSVFLHFCRISGCIMMMPGLSGPRVPVQIRLFLAVGITLALTPLLLDLAPDRGLPATGGQPLVMIGSEMATGLAYGFTARALFLGLQFTGSVIAAVIGYGNATISPIEDYEAGTGVGATLSITATVIVFATGLHFDLLNGLIETYGGVPPGSLTDQFSDLGSIIKIISFAFQVAVQISSPFLVYAVTINIILGIMGRLVPQVQVYFVSAPLVLGGGFVLLYRSWQEIVGFFIASLMQIRSVI